MWKKKLTNLVKETVKDPVKRDRVKNEGRKLLDAAKKKLNKRK